MQVDIGKQPERRRRTPLAALKKYPRPARRTIHLKSYQEKTFESGLLQGSPSRSLGTRSIRSSGYIVEEGGSRRRDTDIPRKALENPEENSASKAVKKTIEAAPGS